MSDNLRLNSATVLDDTTDSGKLLKQEIGSHRYPTHPCSSDDRGIINDKIPKVTHLAVKMPVYDVDPIVVP